MTKREAVIQAVRHQSVESVPYDVSFTAAEADKLAAYLGDSGFRDKLGGYIQTAYYSADPLPLEGRPGYFADAFGVVWNRTGADKDIGVITAPVLPEPDLSLYTFPQLDVPRLRALFGGLQQRQTDCFKMGQYGFSLFERAWTLCGMEDLLVYMVTEERFTHQLFEAITQWNLALLDIALEYEFDAFHFGDDWGQQRGLIMGPDFWRKYIAPCLAQMYQKVKDKGRFVSQHSCGDIEQVFPDLIDMGLDIYQTFQPEIYDIAHVKREFGAHLTFWGGISTQGILPHGTPQQVYRECLDTIAVMNQDGGYIAAPTHAVPGDVPPENILAMLDAFAGGRHPLSGR